jgi:hypothetical protein
MIIIMTTTIRTLIMPIRPAPWAIPSIMAAALPACMSRA